MHKFQFLQLLAGAVREMFNKLCQQQRKNSPEFPVCSGGKPYGKFGGKPGDFPARWLDRGGVTSAENCCFARPISAPCGSRGGARCFCVRCYCTGIETRPAPP